MSKEISERAMAIIEALKKNTASRPQNSKKLKRKGMKHAGDCPKCGLMYAVGETVCERCGAKLCAGE